MTQEKTYVIGHKNPDTDSICSAIALAELKNAQGLENVEAARAGDINPQTAFILERFGVQPPRFLPDVYQRARDIMVDDVVFVSVTTPIVHIMDIMKRRKIRFLPVLDDSGRPIGTITLMELARRYIVTMEAEISREVVTSFANIMETLKAKPVVDAMGSGDATLDVFVGAMAEESFIKTVSAREPSGCAVIVGDRADIQRKSVEMGVSLVIVTGGFCMDDDLVAEARGKGVSVIISPLDSATTALLVRLSTPASEVFDAGFEVVSPDDPVEEVRFKLGGRNGVLVLDNEGVMRGVVTKSCLLKPSSTNLVLVDHNELSQAVDGAETANIVEVVDHHRIGNFSTSHAIRFTCDSVGSTSTLVAELYRASGHKIKKETAGILLGRVLSDTVLLKSPTTTDRDHDIVRWLEEASSLDHTAFGTEIFAATSSIKKRGAGVVVRSDHKVFETKGRSFGVGQVETIGFGEFFDVRDELTTELERIRDEKKLKLSALLVTDIALGTSLLLAVGEKEVIYNLGYPKLDDGLLELKNVISRKKQVVPHILGVFNEIY